MRQTTECALEFNETAHWCAPQKCFTASVWYGDVLMAFYTTDEKRLEADPLRALAIEVLRHVTEKFSEDAAELISTERLWRIVGSAGCLTCYWDDFRPARAIIGSTVCIKSPSGQGPEAICTP